MSGIEQPGTWSPVRSRSDALLASIPVAFVTTVLLGSRVLGSWFGGLAVASLTCILLIIDGLFVHPPMGTRNR